jgi:hypothetical protein
MKYQTLIRLRRKYLYGSKIYRTEPWLIRLLIIIFLAAMLLPLACSPELCGAYTSHSKLSGHKPFSELRK